MFYKEYNVLLHLCVLVYLHGERERESIPQFHLFQFNELICSFLNSLMVSNMYCSFS